MFVGNRCTRPLVTSDPRRPLWGVNPANTSSRRNGPPRRNYGTVTAQRPSTASVGSGRATANPAGRVGAVSCGLTSASASKANSPEAECPAQRPGTDFARGRLAPALRYIAGFGVRPVQCLQLHTATSRACLRGVGRSDQPVRLDLLLVAAGWDQKRQPGRRTSCRCKLFHRAFLRLSVSARATPAAAPTWSWTFTKFTFKERRIKRKIPVKKNSDLRSKSCVRTCVLSAEHTQLAHK